MKNKWLLAIPVIICLALGYYYINTSLKSKVLKQLENNLEFCKVLKQKTTSLSSGKFWLICNGRPFYAELKDNKLSYELNGWSWLKQTEYWDKVIRCNFYSFNGGTLSFICFKEGKLKKLEFDVDNFEIKRIDEINLRDFLFEELRNKFPFLGGCSPEEFKMKESGIYELHINCKQKLIALIDQDSYSVFLLPKELDSDSIKNVFQKLWNVEPTIEDSIATTTFSWGKLSFDFKNVGYSILDFDNVEQVIQNVGSKFLLGFEQDSAKFLKEKIVEELNIKKQYFLVGDQIIIVYLKGNEIVFMDREEEWI
jgi:hypothetical protein